MTEATHVTWGQVLPHMPHQWGKIGKPITLGDGNALCIIRVTTPKLGTLYSVIHYSPDADRISPYISPGDTKTRTFTTSRAARFHVSAWSALEDEGTGEYEPDPDLKRKEDD